jgi:3-oxoacyl-[acyl-carrier-protein] synthase II
MSERNVVVTGMGVVTPIGLTLESFWSNLIAGKSGIDRISRFDVTDFPVKVAGEVRDFDPVSYMDIKMADRSARFSQFAIAASRMAVESSGLDLSKIDSERTGVCIANTIDVGNIITDQERLMKRGPKRINPLFISKTGPHVAAVQVGLLFGAKGPNFSVNSACASGAEALATAYDIIKMGYADVMIAGGTDATIIPLTLAGMWIVGAVTKEEDPAKASRPFDLNRGGFVFGEGSGIVVMETLEHAEKRGAQVLAELAGVSRSFDAYSESAPDFHMEAVAMRNALNDAGIAPENVDYINAHGTGTRLNDTNETRAIKEVFGDRAYAIPVSSNKSMIGHILTAAGTIEAIASIMTMKNNMIPPTINYETPDPECDLDYVPNIARKAEVNVCLSNSFGMGGQNCCLVLKRDTG